MKKKVYLECRPDFSSRLTIHIAPVEIDDQQAVLDQIFSILELEWNGVRTEFIEGLDQTFIDYRVGDTKLQFEWSPWNFVSLLTLDESLREKLWEKLSEAFAVVPMPPRADDE